MKKATARGVVVRRARIVSEPLSDYCRFEYDVTGPVNLAGGEEVRWLPRRRASDIALPGNDFWVLSAYDDAGRPGPETFTLHVHDGGQHLRHPQLPGLPLPRP